MYIILTKILLKIQGVQIDVASGMGLLQKCFWTLEVPKGFLWTPWTGVNYFYVRNKHLCVKWLVKIAVPRRNKSGSGELVKTLNFISLSCHNEGMKENVERPSL